MYLLKHQPSPMSPTFREALRIDTQAGCWIVVAGQVGVPSPPDTVSATFEQQVRQPSSLSEIRSANSAPA